MGSVFKLENSWGIRYEEPGSGRTTRKRKQLSGFATRALAKKALIEIENKINNNVYSTKDNITLSSFFEIWLEDHVKANLAPKTYLYYSGLFENHIKDYFKGISLKELRANNINSFYKYLKDKDLSDDIAFKCHKTLRACLNMAYKWDYASSQVMDKVTSPKEPETTVHFWEPNTIKYAIDILKDSSVYFHIFAALHLGLRLGEVCALNYSDVDFEKKVLNVSKTLQYINGEVIIKSPKTKTSKRSIPLTNNMIEFFRSEMLKQKENQMLLGEKYSKEYLGHFSVFEDGTIKNDSYVTKRFKKDIKETDLPLIKFHDMRHSCASWLLYNGVDLKIIQEILGHASFSTTADLYSHIVQEKKKEALENLSF
jgi:integrase